MNIGNMTDEQVLGKFIEFLGKRVSITTGFAGTGQNGTLTHQFLIIKCGDLEVISGLEPLGIPLRLITTAESGATIH